MAALTALAGLAGWVMGEKRRSRGCPQGEADEEEAHRGWREGAPRCRAPVRRRQRAFACRGYAAADKRACA